SQLGYRFDMALESVERALEREHYVLDRWWLPWPMTIAGPKENGAGSEGERKRRSQVAQEGALAEKEPGLPPVRHVPGEHAEPNKPGQPGRMKPGMLVLFVVGELPTAGVHKVAMRRALDLGMQLGDHRPLRVLGPSFTGTQTSLSIVLGEWLKAN